MVIAVVTVLVRRMFGRFCCFLQFFLFFARNIFVRWLSDNSKLTHLVPRAQLLPMHAGQTWPQAMQRARRIVAHVRRAQSVRGWQWYRCRSPPTGRRRPRATERDVVEEVFGWVVLQNEAFATLINLATKF